MVVGGTALEVAAAMCVPAVVEAIAVVVMVEVEATAEVVTVAGEAGEVESSGAVER
jgi:hypothetical protein